MCIRDRYTEQLLAAAANTIEPGFREAVAKRVVSFEPNARLVLTKVELGEADAAVVYASDTTRRHNVAAVPIPAAINVTVNYHAAVATASRHPRLAEAWIDYIASEPGRAHLVRHGFSTPP